MMQCVILEIFIIPLKGNCMFARVPGTLSMKIEQYREDEYNITKMNIGCMVSHDNNPRQRLNSMLDRWEGVENPLSISDRKVEITGDTFQ